MPTNPAAENAARIVSALAMRAATLRKQAAGRKLAGTAKAMQRKALRDDADRYDLMARRIMGLNEGQLGLLYTWLGA